MEINGYTISPDNSGDFIGIWEDVLDDNGGLIGDEFVTADNLTPFFDLFDSATFSPQSQVIAGKTIF